MLVVAPRGLKNFYIHETYKQSTFKERRAETQQKRKAEETKKKVRQKNFLMISMTCTTISLKTDAQRIPSLSTHLHVSGVLENFTS